ncbi:MAG: carboxypeptidase-like regulatory domain-containing protein, partial [Mangrovimonas sp.]|nr:carboxypeptidase-like regulatory domain-containing protein [Mangrovimonas sp.]
MLKPKHITLLLALFFTVGISFSQEDTTVKGVVVNAADGNPLENVNIVNINQVRGTATNVKGEFEISAKVNDTLHLSYLGFKSIRVR